MIRPNLSILIPAAGASQRLGQAKQLVKYRNRALIQNTVHTALSTDPLEIIVVTGANATGVKNAIKDDEVRWIHNPDWSSGLGGSIALGATGVSLESTGLMILLCDQWRIEPQDLQHLVAKWRSSPGSIVVSEAGGLYTPPVIFPVACFKELKQLKGQQGARTVLNTHPELLLPVTLENAAYDLDTPAHLEMIEKNNRDQLR